MASRWQGTLSQTSVSQKPASPGSGRLWVELEAGGTTGEASPLGPAAAGQGLAQADLERSRGTWPTYWEAQLGQGVAGLIGRPEVENGSRQGDLGYFGLAQLLTWVNPGAGPAKLKTSSSVNVLSGGKDISDECEWTSLLVHLFHAGIQGTYTSKSTLFFAEKDITIGPYDRVRRSSVTREPACRKSPLLACYAQGRANDFVSNNQAVASAERFMIIPLPPLAVRHNLEIGLMEADIVEEMQALNGQVVTDLLMHLEEEIKTIVKTLRGRIDREPEINWTPEIRQLKEQLQIMIRNLKVISSQAASGAPKAFGKIAQDSHAGWQPPMRTLLL
ncbi:hypothetical protein M5K25_006596 [Dendrobium thyrsiflorum]|uniref:Uncharacterized protein n=1 Tax=Dendrobium thyrsiflorum TaxID=117978 RepID=A0ABD0VC93_DENTH